MVVCLAPVQRTLVRIRQAMHHGSFWEGDHGGERLMDLVHEPAAS